MTGRKEFGFTLVKSSPIQLGKGIGGAVPVNAPSARQLMCKIIQKMVLFTRQGMATRLSSELERVKVIQKRCGTPPALHCCQNQLTAISPYTHRPRDNFYLLKEMGSCCCVHNQRIELVSAQQTGHHSVALC